ncbi:toll/interleukin-1 receptor domain-containing protein [Mesorhizobium sp. 1B3]|uniref:toll/interleukin-1 receptor domain-containing protein n=1 Tax=Mesorhizobium sp. 1B3 TaxID=3243599 RepID=UPI003D977A58
MSALDRAVIHGVECTSTELNPSSRRQVGTEKFRIFLSYSRKDITFADQLATALEAFTYDVSIDRKSIHGAENWRERLGSMILEADSVVFLLTPNSAGSDVCRWEIDRALELNKRIVPALLAPLGSSKLHPALQQLNYVRFFADPAAPGSGWGSGLAQLNAALSVDVDWIREHTRVAGLASRWEKSDCHPDLLVRGSELVALRQWRNTIPLKAPALTPLQSAFLEASETAEVAQQNSERERLAEVKIAQDARAAALREKETALEQAADAHRRRARWRNLLFAVVTVAAALTGWLFLQALDERREAEAYFQRATAAELAARRAEAEATKSALQAVTNEFMTSVALLNAEPFNIANRDNYLETGVRLGFALIRNNRNTEALQQFETVRRKLDEHFIRVDKDSESYYSALVKVGAAAAKINQQPPTSTGRASINDELSGALALINSVVGKPDLEAKWAEDLFRAYFYVINFQLASGNYSAASVLASDIDARISLSAPIPRLKARSKGLLAWCAILSKNKEEAMTSSLDVIRFTDEHKMHDLSTLRLNYAHALLINGDETQARLEYMKYRPDDVKSDFEQMLKAGLCYPLFKEYSEISPACK